MSTKYHNYAKNLQNLMGIAYARWQDPSNKWSPGEFMAQLTTAEAVAVRLGNMNYQVENGGFYQYWGNSYATRETVAAVGGYLRQIVSFAAGRGDARLKAAAEVLRLYRSFDEILDGNYDPNAPRPSRSYWESSDDDEELDPNVSHLDSPYYDVNDDFMCLAEDWLAATFVLPSLPEPAAA